MAAISQWGDVIGTRVEQATLFNKHRERPTHTYRLPSEFLQILQHYNLLNNKHIPQSLLTAAPDIRMHLLAGIIDGNGQYRVNFQRYAVGAGDARRMHQYKFLAKSLGFRVGVVSPKTRDRVTRSGSQAYHSCRINMSGNNLAQLSKYIKTPQKRCPSVPRRSDANCWGFTVNKVEPGSYHSFTVSGHGRLLMKDFTVTHAASMVSSQHADQQPTT